MNRISPLRNWTLVFLLCFNFSALAEDSKSADSGTIQAAKLEGSKVCGPGRTVGPTNINTGMQECVEDSRQKDCRNVMKEMNEAKGKFLGICSNAYAGNTKDTCSDKLDSCAEESKSELSLATLLGNYSGVSQVKSQCSPFSYKDYATELKNAKQVLDDSNKKVDDAREKLAKAEAAHSEKMNDMTEKTAKDKADQHKEDSDETTAERATEVKNQEEEENLSKSLLEFQSQLNALKLKQLEATQQRAEKLDLFATGAKRFELECYMETEKKAKEFRHQRKRQMLTEFKKTCLLERFKARDRDIRSMTAAIDSLNDEKDKVENNIRSVEKKIALRKQHAIQELVQKSKNAEEKISRNLQKQFLDSQRASELAYQMQQDRIRINDSITRATMALNQASNDLNGLQAQAPVKGASKSLSDAKEAMFTWATKDCMEVCAGITDFGLEEKCKLLKKEVPASIQEAVGGAQ